MNTRPVPVPTREISPSNFSFSAPLDGVEFFRSPVLLNLILILRVPPDRSGRLLSLPTMYLYCTLLLPFLKRQARNCSLYTLELMRSGGPFLHDTCDSICSRLGSEQS